MPKKIFVIAGIGVFAALWSGCSAKSVYYFPNRELYRDPHELGLEYDMVSFPSANGKKLCGLYFKSETQPAKGVIIHFHGNYGNVSHHFGQSTFLTKYGFDVFIFDYQGYGASEGKSTPQNTVEDGRAAIRYLQSSTVSANLPIGLFGQSIGAAVATVVAAENPEARAAVLEAGFSSYKAILKDVLKRSWLMKPFAYFVPWMIAQRGLDPVDFIGRIAPRPVFIIHGDRDRTIPYWMGEALYKNAREPKTLWKVPNADHLQCQAKQGKKYEQDIADFFAGAFEKSSKENNTGTIETQAPTLPVRK